MSTMPEALELAEPIGFKDLFVNKVVLGDNNSGEVRVWTPKFSSRAALNFFPNIVMLWKRIFAPPLPHPPAM